MCLGYALHTLHEQSVCAQIENKVRKFNSLSKCFSRALHAFVGSSPDQRPSGNSSACWLKDNGTSLWVHISSHHPAPMHLNTQWMATQAAFLDQAHARRRRCFPGCKWRPKCAWGPHITCTQKVWGSHDPQTCCGKGWPWRHVDGSRVLCSCGVPWCLFLRDVELLVTAP